MCNIIHFSSLSKHCCVSGVWYEHSASEVVRESRASSGVMRYPASEVMQFVAAWKHPSRETENVGDASLHSRPSPRGGATMLPTTLGAQEQSCNGATIGTVLICLCLLSVYQPKLSGSKLYIIFPGWWFLFKISALVFWTCQQPTAPTLPVTEAAVRHDLASTSL